WSVSRSTFRGRIRCGWIWWTGRRCGIPWNISLTFPLPLRKKDRNGNPVAETCDRRRGPRCPSPRVPAERCGGHGGKTAHRDRRGRSERQLSDPSAEYSVSYLVGAGNRAWEGAPAPGGHTRRRVAGGDAARPVPRGVP